MRRVTSIEQIVRLADQRKAVVYGPWRRRTAAAFMQNWPGRVLVNVIRTGVFIYEPKKRGQKK